MPSAGAEYPPVCTVSAGSVLLRQKEGRWMRRWVQGLEGPRTGEASPPPPGWRESSFRPWLCSCSHRVGDDEPEVGDLILRLMSLILLVCEDQGVSQDGGLSLLTGASLRPTRTTWSPCLRPVLGTATLPTRLLVCPVATWQCFPHCAPREWPLVARCGVSLLPQFLLCHPWVFSLLLSLCRLLPSPPRTTALT